MGDIICFHNSDPKHLRERLHDAWDNLVWNEISHRVNLREMSDFSLSKTRQLLKQLPCHQRVLVVMQIAGCIQTEHCAEQVSIWRY